MTRILGMAVGVLYFVIASGAYRNASRGWEAGHADLGVWWTVIGVILTIAALGALIGTWLHTRPARS
jgi:hypothetical protein